MDVPTFFDGSQFEVPLSSVEIQLPVDETSDAAYENTLRTFEDYRLPMESNDVRMESRMLESEELPLPYEGR